MAGFVAGKVTASHSDKFAVGELFGAYLPFTTVQAITGEALATTRIWKLGDIPEDRVSLGLGVLGMPGSAA